MGPAGLSRAASRGAGRSRRDTHFPAAPGPGGTYRYPDVAFRPRPAALPAAPLIRPAVSFDAVLAHLSETWPVWVVTLLTLYATWIDATQLRVPNKLTYPMILAGLMYNSTLGDGWWFGLAGTLCGLGTLLPLYAVGGMGSGDVKLMGGIGAWLGWQVTLNAFVVVAVAGAAMAVFMAVRGGILKHLSNSVVILNDWKSGMSLRDISAAAAERKPNMTLLPYGVPICVGCLGYFLWAGMY